MSANESGHADQALPKVLVLGPATEGGVSSFLRMLVTFVRSEGVPVAYMPIGKTSAMSLYWRRPWEYTACVLGLIRTLRSFDPSLVHFNPCLTGRSLPLSLVLLALTRVLTDARVLLFFHGWDPAIAQRLSKKSVTAIPLRSLLRLADGWATMSACFKEALVTAGFPAARVFVGRPMVDTAEFPQRRLELDCVSASTSPLQVLFLSNLVAGKGVDVVADCIQWLKQNPRSIQVRFTIAGAGPERKMVERRFPEELLHGEVCLPGYVSYQEKLRLLSSSDVFLFPSTYREGFPAAVVEAMAAGLPIVYTPVGGLADALGPNNGIRIEIPRLSGETVAEALLALYADPQRRLTIGTANQALARSKYDISVVADEVLQHYWWILRANRSS